MTETQLQISLLGEFNLIFQGQTITAFSGDRPISLLAYLLLHRHTPVSRQHLAFTLWPDSSESQARTNLRNLLYTLRRTLPDADAYIAVDAMTLQWRAETAFVLDVAAFEAALQAAASASGDERRHWLEAAVESYAGDLLPGNYDDWIMPLRETLRQAYLGALDELVRLFAARKEYRSAARYSQRLLLHDPLDEPAYVQLMQLYVLNGDRAGVQRTYAQCVAALRRELDVEPGAATQAAYAQFLRMETPAAPTTASHTTASHTTASTVRATALPSPTAPFIGREAELAQLAELLADPTCRLLTVIGPGGIGKTRLALQTAIGHRPVYADGVAWVALTDVQMAEQLGAAIADALNHRLMGADAEHEVLHLLADRKLLLVLDNFEHLLEAADFLARIVHQAPGVMLLVTSRHALHLLEEWRYELGEMPLPVEDDADTLAENSAVQLFIQSARRAAPTRGLTHADYLAAARICRLVGGMPLGIELAASWMRLLTCTEIADEIAKSLDFLTATARNLPPRHRSLRAIFDHSWALLTVDEQQALARLALFHGSFTREAAVAVADAELALLSALADQSLLQRTGTGRYVLHDVIRQYAREQLAANPVVHADAARRHGEFYLRWLADQDSGLRSAAQKQTLADIAQEFPNIRVAWQWAVGQKLPVLLQSAAFPLFYFLELRNRLQEAESLFRSAGDALLAAGEPLPRIVIIAGCEMRTNQAYFVTRLGQGPIAQTMLQGAVTQLQQLGEEVVLGFSLRYLGILLSARGLHGDAATTLQSSFELSIRRQDHWGAAVTQNYLGVGAYDQGRLDDSHALLADSLARSRTLGDPRLIAFSLLMMARTDLQTGRVAEAAQQLSECLQIAQETDDLYNLTYANLYAGVASQMQGDFDAARRRIQQSMTLSALSTDVLALKRAALALGFLELASSAAAAAQPHFLEILSDNQRMHAVKFILAAVLGMATLRASQGDAYSALVWTLAVLRHPTLDWEAQARGVALCAALETELTADAVHHAQEASAHLAFADVLADILHHAPPSS